MSEVQPQPESSEVTHRTEVKPQEIPLHQVANWFGWHADGGMYFDSARRDDSDIASHFAAADCYEASPDTHADDFTRQRITNAARYESENNGWLRGMGRTYKHDLVGTTPRIQIIDKRLSEEDRNDIEKKFHRWCRDVRFAKKLRALVLARRRDGEGLAVIFNYEDYQDFEAEFDEDFDAETGEFAGTSQEETTTHFRNPVKLGFRLFECDRLKDHHHSLATNEEYRDGIKYDRYGEPFEYRILKKHPGSAFATDVLSGDEEPYLYAPANRVIHLFELERAEQHRGVSEYQPTLVIGSLFRQFRRSVVRTARNAARLFPILKTSMTPAAEKTTIQTADGETREVIMQPQCKPQQTMPLNEDVATALPIGYDIDAVKADQPNSEYGDFTKTTVNEMGRPTGMPSSKAQGNYDDTSYSGGRLNERDYHRGIDVDRFDVGVEGLDKVFAAWWSLAILVEDYLPQKARELAGPEDYPEEPEHCWHFDGFADIDELKSANATIARLRSLTTTPQREWAKQGSDFEVELQSFARSLGVDADEIRKRYLDYLWPDKMLESPVERQQRERERNLEDRIYQLESIIEDRLGVSI